MGDDGGGCAGYEGEIQGGCEDVDWVVLRAVGAQVGGACARSFYRQMHVRNARNLLEAEALNGLRRKSV